MIEAGLTLALVGMGVVFIFLILLVVIVSVTARILAPQTAIELAQIEAEAAAPAAVKQRRIVAAISAAISLHRRGRRGNS
jgi:sodium pump decarboxylase gamma subunit